MATVEIVFADAGLRGVYGSPMPALASRPAIFVGPLAVGSSAVVQVAGVDWVAPEDGYAYFTTDAKIYARFFGPGDVTAAGPGAGWPIGGGVPMVLAFRRGDSLRLAAA